MFRKTTFIGCLGMLSLGPVAATVTACSSDHDDLEATNEQQLPATSAPLVPPELSSDPYDPDYIFAGYEADFIANLPALEQSALQDERLTEGMSDAELEQWEEQRVEQDRDRERAEAIAQGKVYDERPDLAVIFINGQMWRKKGEVFDWPDTLEDSPSDTGNVSPDEEEAPPPPTAIDPDLPDGYQASIIGLSGDNRKLRSRHNGYNMTQIPYRWLGGLQGGTTNPQLFGCSGGKIYARVVITAGHCIPSTTNGSSVFWPGADGIDNLLNGRTGSPNGTFSAPGTLRAAHPKWVKYGWRGWDVGVIKFPSNSSITSLGNFGVSSSLGLLQQTVNLWGYPGSSLECSDSPAPNDRCRGSLYGMSGKITAVTARRVHVNIDTQEGQSGSPIYRIVNGNRYVVGVYTTGWTSVDNQGTRLTSSIHDWLRAQRDNL